MENINKLNSFQLDSLPDLDVAVLGALELFQKENIPKIDLKTFQHPLVVGSGNAEATGRIIFEKSDAVFASESNFEEKLKNIENIDGVVIISASGEKHAPIVASKAKEHKKRAVLITNKKESSASKVVDEVYVFPKNREPYTYNTSTYLGMVLGYTGESASNILDFIKNEINKISFEDFSKRDKFYFVVPSEFSGVCRMVQIKFIELFGRRISRDVETVDYATLHATTVVPSDEMFVCFGTKEDGLGNSENRLDIPLPKNANYGAMIAISYYVVAQIQKSHPQYFKENIERYMNSLSDKLGHKMSPIVE